MTYDMWNITQWNTFATATLLGDWVNDIVKTLFYAFIGYITFWLWQRRPSNVRWVLPLSVFWQLRLLGLDGSGVLAYAQWLWRSPRSASGSPTAPSSPRPDVGHVGVNIPPSFDCPAQAYDNQSTSLGEQISRDRTDETIPEASVDQASGLMSRNSYRVQSGRDPTIDFVLMSQPAGVTEQSRTIPEESHDLEALPQPENLQFLPKHEVGLAPRVDELKRLLLNNQRVAIVGFGGTGKTTFARKLFNTLNCQESYDCTGFFLSVKEQWPTRTLDLRVRILDNLYEHGKQMKREGLQWNHLKTKKVLLVLDDVNSRDHLPDFMDEFAEGSHLIVTSRIDTFLTDFHIYEMPKLDEENSRKLFCTHAFRGNSQDEELHGIIDKLIRKCDGLPLTLEAVGSALFKRKYEIWKEMPGRIEDQEILDGSDGTYRAILRSCYDVLGPEEKEMFLDVAALIPAFQMPQKIFERSYLEFRDLKMYWERICESPHTSWRNLKARRLVSESSGWTGKEEVSMHEHFRDLACKLAWKKDTNLKSHLRICLLNDQSRPEYESKFQDGMDLLLHQNDEGAFNAKAVLLNNPVSEDHISTRLNVDLKVFSKFLDLRFLILNHVCLIGGHAEFPRNLAVLRMDNCYSPSSAKSPGPLPVSFNAERLVALTVVFQYKPSSLINIAGLTKALRSPANKLRFLRVEFPPDMWGSLALDHVELSTCLAPKFLPVLEELRIDGWSVVERLPNSFSNLERLRTVTISNYDALAELPSFMRLSSLELLEIRNCPRLKSSPLSSGLPASLKRLSIINCRSLGGDLWGPVVSMGNASKLQYLHLNDVGSSLSVDIWRRQLRALASVTFQRCDGLTCLPGSFGQLGALLELTIEFCGKLETLNSVNCGGLSNLRNLRIANCRLLKQLPESFGELSALISVSIDYCSQLKHLPESFGELSALRSLRIANCPLLKQLPESFGELSALVSFSIDYCSQLKYLPESFGELSALSSFSIAYCSQLKHLPESFGELCALSSLSVRWCQLLKQLPRSFGHLRRLQTLSIDGCKMLQSLSEDFGLLASLQKCTLGYCKNLRKLPKTFVQLAALEELAVYQCPFLDPLLRTLSMHERRHFWVWEKQNNPIGSCFSSLEDAGDLFESSRDDTVEDDLETTVYSYWDTWLDDRGTCSQCLDRGDIPPLPLDDRGTCSQCLDRGAIPSLPILVLEHPQLHAGTSQYCNNVQLHR